jgi:hypothetical protein
MSLLGFDALGRWALAQLPSNGNLTLVTVRGSVALAGQAAAFTTSEPALAAGFLATGISAGFGVAEAASPGPFAVAGNAAAFKALQSGQVGSFLVAGAGANGAIRAAVSPGAVSLSGNPLQFSVSLASGQGAFVSTGGGSTYSRGHEAWVRQPFDTMSWQTEANLLPPTWNGAAPPASVWTADVPPANAWTPAQIETEPWTNE